jgi:hypothetical protein
MSTRTRYRQSLPATLIVALLMALPNAGIAGETLTVVKPTFAKGTRIPDKVKFECKLPEKLADFIESNAGKSFDQVQISDKAGSGKVLLVEITDAEGLAGGQFSGAKSVNVSGKLMNGGKVIGTFKGKRSSGGGASFGYKGTCSILGRCVKALGKDIGVWLKSPGMNDRLGEFK